MAVVFPVEEDKIKLEEFAQSFCQTHSLSDAINNKYDTRQRALRTQLAFTTDELASFSEVCSLALHITEQATHFFTAGNAHEVTSISTIDPFVSPSQVKLGEVQSEREHNTQLFQGSISPFHLTSTSSTSSSLRPAEITKKLVNKKSRIGHGDELSVTLWQYSLKKLIVRHVPLEYLIAHVNEMIELQHSLQHIVETLRSLNKKHAYIFTVNGLHIKAYVNALDKQKRSRLTPLEQETGINEVNNETLIKYKDNSTSNNSYSWSNSSNYNINNNNNSTVVNKNNNVIDNTAENQSKQDVNQVLLTKASSDKVNVDNAEISVDIHHHQEQEQKQEEKREPRLVSTSHNSNSSSVNANDLEEHIVTHIDSSMLAMVEDAELPSVDVRQSYAIFIGLCQMLLEWTSQLLAVTYRVDSVPQSGTFILPPNTDLSASLPNSLSAMINVPDHEINNNNSNNNNNNNNNNLILPRSRVVSVQRYQTYNVQQFYDLLVEQAQRTFDLNNIAYDPELQRMCVSSSCVHSLIDVINECALYISRLEDVEAGRLAADFIDPYFFPYEAYASNTNASADSYSASHSYSSASGNSSSNSYNNNNNRGCKIVFTPSLSTFRLLRTLLRLYLSVSVNAHERTSLHEFEQRYREISLEAREMTCHINTLPNPHKSQMSEQNEHNIHETKANREASNVNSNINVNNEPNVNVATQTNKAQWEPAPEERRQLNEYFEKYWTVRDKIYALVRDMQKDMKSRNKTHCVRIMRRYVINEIDDFAQRAEEWNVHREHRMRTNSYGSNNNNSMSSNYYSSFLWNKVCNVGAAFMNTITCQAEVFASDNYLNNNNNSKIEGFSSSSSSGSNNNSSKVDDMKMPLTKYSAQYSLKQLLYTDVQQLWRAIDVQGMQLEKIYIGQFHRSERDKWLHYVETCMKQVSKVSVVFDA